MRVPPQLLDREKPPYALPTMLTAGTLFCGYYCLMKTVQAISLPPESAAMAARLYDHAAMAIGIAVLTDGLDGRVARATGSTSDFGREIDSLADAITFGVAPATLAFAWGIRAPELRPELWLGKHLPSIGYLVAFLFMLCGAARLARFNVQKNPQPKNPGRPGTRYFVGLPIPAAAGMLAAVVHVRGGIPIENWWPNGALWLGLMAMLSFLMISSWRYSSFKDLNLMRTPGRGIVVIGALIFLVWNYSQIVLLAIASLFTLSGVYSRIAWLVQRDKRLTEPGESAAGADGAALEGGEEAEQRA